MSRNDPEENKPGLWEQFRKSENPWVSLARELAWVAAVVGGIALALFLVSGTWPAVVTIESESMVPNMN
ncbi:MAG TPA: S26 family signal peptidase, partial [Methanolinea sp.]|nr:S26 family signal peptidase [Methanolinea sp.]